MKLCMEVTIEKRIVEDRDTWHMVGVYAAAKGPCRVQGCRLHRAHSGPCETG